MKHVITSLPLAAGLFLSTISISQTNANLPAPTPSYVYEGMKQYTSQPVQAPPLIKDDSITGIVNRSISGNVLKNAYDPKGERMTVYLESDSPDGSIGITGNGDFTFTPNKGFEGTTSFKYKVCNGSLCSESATVTINIISAATAPVALNDFTANCDATNNVHLSWTTAAETGNERFNIERSTDGVNFVTVGTVSGQSTSGTPQTYNFTQKVNRLTAEKNDLYYRLKLVTDDDAVATSKVLIARVYKTKTLQLLSVTPNPVANDIRVNAQLNEGAYIVMKVLNQAGTELIRQTVKSPAGMNSYTLEGSSRLEKGMYILEMIVNSNERMVIRLIKD